MHDLLDDILWDAISLSVYVAGDYVAKPKFKITK